MPYTQVTLAELRTAVQAKVESVPYWTTAEYNSAISEALRVWNLLTGHFKVRDTSVTTVLDQVWYTTPSTLLYPFRIAWASRPLEPTTTFDLDYARSNWEGQSTTDTGAPGTPAQWAPCGLNRFCIWPADDPGGYDLQIDGVGPAPIPAGDSSYVNLGQEEQAAIVDYALHYLTFKEGGPRFQGSQDAFQRFLTAAASRNARLNAASFFREALRARDLAREQKPLVTSGAAQ